MILLAVGDSVMQGAGPDLYATLPAVIATAVHAGPG